MIMVSIKHSIYIYRLIYGLWNRDSGPKVGSYSEHMLNLRKSSMLLYAPFVKFTADGRGIYAFIVGGGGQIWPYNEQVCFRSHGST